MRDKNVPISVPFVTEKALQFAKALGFDQFLAQASGSLTETDILNSVTNKNSTSMDCNEDENENDDNAEINKPSYDEMINSFETIRRSLQCEENTPEGIFGALQRCEVYYETKHFFKQKTQEKINKFYE
ncbi:uncharacterized protein NPIL_30291 [Nephila pilipes]|uniref:Uncharacterized protein n=1 Tax=Nephila pilipes TaxID=299642 RepID=A0A8X6MZ32_NEPPI|nr:uncharacterized protein NPIL_30291 [Nephila pilipes]